VQRRLQLLDVRPPLVLLATPEGDAGWQLVRLVVVRDGTTRLVHWRGATYVLERAQALRVDDLVFHPTGSAARARLVAPMPGTVIKVLVEAGQQIAAQTALLVLEAMKMEHVVTAPYAGLVRQIYYPAGALVAKGALLVDLEETTAA